ncbi:glycosyltransferase family 4 protein [Micrococcus sp. IITD107]|uniref:glycosyltransferase family 4 protein n=1 Tax=Micrococcus sp. IITD107 TaxID=3342790 RepID=UPI0035BB4A1A
MNHYAPFLSKEGMSGLHVEIARELRESEIQVHVIGASTSHPAGRQYAVNGDLMPVMWEGTRSYWVHAREYLGNGPDRLLNMFDFGRKFRDPKFLRKLPKPDIIVGRVINPLAAFFCARLARGIGVPFVLEIADIWPETFIQLGKIRRWGPPSVILGSLERWLISQADAVMSPLPGLDRYLADSGFQDKPFYWVPNGVSDDQDVVPTYDKNPNDPFTVMYFGSMGNANAVDTILKAYAIFVAQSETETRLELVGSGPLSSKLKDLAGELGISSTTVFTDRIPRAELVAFAQRADVLVANMRALDLYKYGIALNKLFDYLLCSKPVVFGASALNNLVEDALAGITVPGDNVDELALAMKRMQQLPASQRQKMGESGRTHVLRNYTYRNSAQRFHQMIDDLTDLD